MYVAFDFIFLRRQIIDLFVTLKSISYNDGVESTI